MAQPGILSWATSIRATMVNDPCRQSLQDQIQTHGFLFLDDYLDGILAQATRDPIIDLVKTPGRKRDAPMRTRIAAIYSDQSVPIKDPPTQFPSLPAPSPLRKSMRIQREPSVGTGMGSVPPLPASANATAGAGKCTSWLMKAREAKAMEVPGKRVSTLAPTAVAALGPGMSGGLKRKSGEMLDTTVPGMVGIAASAEDERKRKIAKMDVRAVVSKERFSDVGKGSEPVARIQPEPAIRNAEEAAILIPTEVPQEGIMDRLKRTVEGLGARAGKSMSKSLGGPAAAAALAEAKAAKVAAEARIAERDGRNAVQSGMVDVEPTTSVASAASMDKTGTGLTSPRERKLSVSDLVTVFEDGSNGKFNEKAKAVEKGFKPLRASASNKNHVGDESTSTTPPNSPPSTRTSNTSFALPSGPVFNKPPVFVPPAPTIPLVDFSFNLPSTAISLPPVDLAILPPSTSSQPNAPALSAQSTAVSLYSDAVFDSQNGVPAWMPDTQDTEYSIAQSQTQPSQKIGDLDEDDSWPMVDEKLSAANPSWTPFGFTKEDSMTWSTLPTESQRDTRSTQNHTSQSAELRTDSSAKNVPGGFEMEVDRPDDDLRESDLEDLELDARKSTVALVKPNDPERSQSQMSMASTSSSQSQIGWVGQATKLVSSVLGGSKSKKPVPSLQRAAAAARKEQEEKDKKTARIKEMENRRQVAIQRKVEEEKSKAMEEEKKIKEEGERRKRDREETTDKRPLKAGLKKVDEDTTKKRKITIEVEKKLTESKKPPSKEKKDAVASSRMPPPLSTSTTTKPSVANKYGGGFKPAGPNPLLSSCATNAPVASGSTTVVKPAETKTVKSATASATSSTKRKTKAKTPDDGGLSQPARQLQAQMAARARAQIQAAKQLQAESENIELPDINSEYSDSDDEERPRTFDPPDWAQSPELSQQLHMQRTVNPDDIFGPIRPLKMEEVFRTRHSRFRARTSSANWTGNDRLTVEEEKEYARRMGFR